jgi:hypothetical protein
MYQSVGKFWWGERGWRKKGYSIWPRRQATESRDRFVSRASLEKLFSQTRGKRSRDEVIAKAVTRYGYSQMELASFLGLHYSTISRLFAATDKQQR